MTTTFETPSMKAQKTNEKTQNKLNQIKMVMVQSSLDTAVVNEKSVLVALDLYAKRVLKKVENGKTLNDHDMTRFLAAYDAAQYGHENKAKITRYRFNKYRQVEEQLLEDIKNESIAVEVNEVDDTSDQTIQSAVTPDIDFSSFEKTDEPVEETVLPDLNIAPTDIDMTDIEAAIAASISKGTPKNENASILNIVPNSGRVLDDTQTNISNQASRTPFNDNLRSGLNDNTNHTSPKSSRWSFKNIREKAKIGLAAVAATAVIAIASVSMFNAVSNLETAKYSDQQQPTIEVAESQKDTATQDVAKNSAAEKEIIYTGQKESKTSIEVLTASATTNLNVEGISKDKMVSDKPATFDKQDALKEVAKASAEMKYQNSGPIVASIKANMHDGDLALHEIQVAKLKDFGQSLTAGLQGMLNAAGDALQKEASLQNHPSHEVAEATFIPPLVDPTKVVSLDTKTDSEGRISVPQYSFADLNLLGKDSYSIVTASSFSSPLIQKTGFNTSDPIVSSGMVAAVDQSSSLDNSKLAPLNITPDNVQSSIKLPTLEIDPSKVQSSIEVAALNINSDQVRGSLELPTLKIDPSKVRVSVDVAALDIDESMVPGSKKTSEKAQTQVTAGDLYKEYASAAEGNFSEYKSVSQGIGLSIENIPAHTPVSVAAKDPEVEAQKALITKPENVAAATSSMPAVEENEAGKIYSAPITLDNMDSSITKLFAKAGRSVPQEIQDHLNKPGKYGKYDAYRFLSEHIQGEAAYHVAMDGMKNISMSGQGKVSRLAADAFNSTAYMQKQYNVTTDTNFDFASVKIIPAPAPKRG